MLEHYQGVLGLKKHVCIKRLASQRNSTVVRSILFYLHPSFKLKHILKTVCLLTACHTNIDIHKCQRIHHIHHDLHCSQGPNVTPSNTWACYSQTPEPKYAANETVLEL